MRRNIDAGGRWSARRQGRGHRDERLPAAARGRTTPCVVAARPGLRRRRRRISADQGPGRCCPAWCRPGPRCAPRCRRAFHPPHAAACQHCNGGVERSRLGFDVKARPDRKPVLVRLGRQSLGERRRGYAMLDAPGHARAARVDESVRHVRGAGFDLTATTAPARAGAVRILRCEVLDIPIATGARLELDAPDPTTRACVPRSRARASADLGARRADATTPAPTARVEGDGADPRQEDTECSVGVLQPEGAMRTADESQAVPGHLPRLVRMRSPTGGSPGGLTIPRRTGSA